MALRLVGHSDIDLQDRVRLHHRGHARDVPDRFLQLQNALIDRWPLVFGFEEQKHQGLGASGAAGKPGQREELRDVWIVLQFLINLLLVDAHLCRGRAFLGDKDAANEPTVTRREQGKGKMGEEKPKPEDANEDNRNG